MTTGEKRSVTSSMNKASELFDKNSTSFESKRAYIQEFYTFWVDYSIKNKLSWCFDKKSGLKEYQQSSNFQAEMNVKIAELFAEELAKIIEKRVEKVKQVASLKELDSYLRPLRSKKKRLRQKRQKLQAM